MNQTHAARQGWTLRDGAPVTCPDKLRMLEETTAELRTALQDALDDAVLMGLDASAYRAALAALVAGLTPSWRDG